MPMQHSENPAVLGDPPAADPRGPGHGGPGSAQPGAVATLRALSLA